MDWSEIFRRRAIYLLESGFRDRCMWNKRDHTLYGSFIGSIVEFEPVKPASECIQQTFDKIIIKKNPKKRGEVVKNLVLLGLSFCGELWGTCGKKWRGLWVVGTIRTNRTIVRGRRLQITCTPWCDVYTVTWTSYRNHMIHSLFFIEPFVSHLGINPPLIFPTAKHYIVYPPSNLSTWHHIYSLTRNWPQSDWSLMGLVRSVFHHLVSSRQIESPAVLISTPCQKF